MLQKALTCWFLFLYTGQEKGGEDLISQKKYAAESAFCRVRKTTPQVQLNAVSRTSNIRDAFSVRKAKYIKGKNIALVDDVYTTGATSDECSKMLLHAGAKSVSLLIIAR